LPLSRALSLVGVLTTLAYLGVVAWLFGGRIAEIAGMDPNHVGDFLAGVFGPLAILWLILGFFQQGVELRLNTRALDLQAQELKSASREQRELLAALKNQLDAERATLALRREEYQQSILPRFVFTELAASTEASPSSCRVRVHNLGANASAVRVNGIPALAAVTPAEFPLLLAADNAMLEFRSASGRAQRGDQLIFSFRDVRNRGGSATFRLVVSDTGAVTDIVPDEP
jgi:hypothetical protein